MSLSPPEGIWRVKNQVFDSNTYICRLSDGGALLIDPGLDTEGIAHELERLGLRPLAIVCTHGHFDHLGSARFFQAKFRAALYLHPSDSRIARSSNFLLMACKINHRIEVPDADGALADGLGIAVGEDMVTVYHTPGHTPGSCMIEFRGAVFTGDTLYHHSIGLVNFPGEDKDLLKQSVLGVWERFPETHWVFPGHGSSARFGEIKETNSQLREFLGLDAT